MIPDSRFQIPERKTFLLFLQIRIIEQSPVPGTSLRPAPCAPRPAFPLDTGYRVLGTGYSEERTLLRDPDNIESQFLHNILSPSAGKILEIGCGDGRLTAELLKVSDGILALDPDPGSIEKARYLLEKGVRLILGSGESLPLADNTIDTVIFSQSLHHHPDPGNALDQAQRSLKEGGRILVMEPESNLPLTGALT